jgi:hypothetical protein
MHHIDEIQRAADDAQNDEVGEPHGACDHHGRIGRADFLVGDGECGLRQAAAAFDARLLSGRSGCGGRGSGVQHRACVDRFHFSLSPFLRAPNSARGMA